ncbi:MAG: S8/S53 family peptidase [Caldilineales bacterium]|nr:S8/S53 family peptidase [Caldilineales bacterium]
MVHRSSPSLRLGLLAALALLLAACMPMPLPTPQPPPPGATPAPPPSPEKPTEPPADWCVPLAQGAGQAPIPADLKPGELFLPRQVILTGRRSEVAKVVEALPDLELRPLREPIDLSYLEKLARPDRPEQKPQAADAVAAGPLPWPDSADLAVQLYGVGAATPVPEVVSRVYAAAAEAGVVVAADPNYVTGFPIVGSPWEIEGSPWEIEGSPGGGSPVEAQPLFWKQWGFVEAAGIVSGGSLQPGSRTVKPTGRGVTVAVFDTAPFETGGLHLLRQIEPPLALCVTKGATAVSYPNLRLRDVSNHGVFVAGLAFGVAPDARYHLVEVLNSTGQGDLVTLLDMLNRFMAQSADPARPQPWGHTVVNLSLGVPDPKDAGLAPTLLPLMRRVLSAGGAGYAPPLPDRHPIVALEMLLASYVARGGTVVAAAGNRSFDVSAARPAQIPAAYPFVVGVAASNQKGQRSCYANAGDIAAPGGDGAPAAGGSPACTPSHTACPTDRPDCPYGVISLTRDGYAYWVGSSFATPMVSGAAALWLEAGTAPETLFLALKTAGPRPDLGRGVLDLAGGVP